MPSPKKVETRWRVRSKNWSGMTNSSGLCSSFNEPTAEMETIRSTPSCLNAIDVRAKIQLGRQDAMAASMAGQKRNFPAFEHA